MLRVLFLALFLLGSVQSSSALPTLPTGGGLGVLSATTLTLDEMQLGSQTTTSWSNLTITGTAIHDAGGQSAFGTSGIVGNALKINGVNWTIASRSGFNDVTTVLAPGNGSGVAAKLVIPGKVIQRAAGSTGRQGRNVQYSGTYTGNAPSGLDIQLTYGLADLIKTPGNVFQAWTACTGLSASANVWSCTINEPLADDWVIGQVRDHTATSVTSQLQANYHGVGINIHLDGQSNMGLILTSGTTTLTGSINSLVRRYGAAGWRPLSVPFQVAWDAVNPNDAQIRYANEIENSCGCPVGIFGISSAGTVLKAWLTNANGGFSDTDSTQNTWWFTTSGGGGSGASGDGSAGTVTIAATGSTYNSGTGAVSLNMSGAHGFNVGDSFTVTAITGTGGFASLNGTWTATVGTTGSTLNFTGPTGLGTTTITGGTDNPGKRAGLNSSNLLYGKDFEIFVWQQGEQDIGNASYATQLAALYGQMQTVTGRSAAQLKMIEVPLGTAVPAPDFMVNTSDAGWTSMRSTQLTFIAGSAPNTLYGGSAVDVTHDPYTAPATAMPSIHWDDADRQEVMKRYAQAALKAAALQSGGAEGPTISKAVMATSSNVVTVTVAHARGTALVDATGNSAGTGLAGFQVFLNGSTTPSTISSSAIASATTVALTMGFTRGGGDTVTLGYQQGSNPGSYDWLQWANLTTAGAGATTLTDSAGLGLFTTFFTAGAGQVINITPSGNFSANCTVSTITDANNVVCGSSPTPGGAGAAGAGKYHSINAPTTYAQFLYDNFNWAGYLYAGSRGFPLQETNGLITVCASC